MTSAVGKKMFTQLNAKPVKKQKYIKHNQPKKNIRKKQHSQQPEHTENKHTKTPEARTNKNMSFQKIIINDGEVAV